MTTDNNGGDGAVTGLASAMRAFLAMESAGGILLVAMMVLALVVVNSPLGGWYQGALDLHVALPLGVLTLDKSVLHWINDGLMAVFFLLVALEIKREMLEGELSRLGQVMLPALGALGGMAVPALIYAAFTAGSPALRGWAIPSATDIAFSLGVLSVLGRAVPTSLRVFLTALAIIDDLGAILIIAFFYSGALSPFFLAGAGAAVAVLVGLNLLGVRTLWAYLPVGAVLWVCMLESGVHATVAGVLLGLCIPLQGAPDPERAPLRRLEHALHPWVAFAILPLFALANSGLSLAGMGLSALADPIFLGVALGLFIGKQLGVFACAWAVIKAGWATLPEGAGWRHLYGTCVLTGIGFTMSLFIAGLAFPDGDGIVATRLGVLLGSVVSAFAGYLIIAAGRKRPTA
ncbi:MAG TPA: Na+/H+ antiporter NhaA [Magnetospirillum sp.]|nr:Na+/H+ antiporter NhaA [Magnetospirillum sp.]